MQIMKRLMLGAAALVLGAAHGAYAEDADETVIVTATRHASDARALPADVTVIEAGESFARGEVTLEAALAHTPGLDIVRAGSLGQQTSLFIGGANSGHALVLFDGLRLNDSASPASAFDAGQDMAGALARIEIVEGPMSALYGSDALGGAINLLPRHGGAGALNARLDVAGGSFDTLVGAASVNGTIGALRYAVSAEGFATGGYDVVPTRMATHTGDPDGAASSTLTGVFDLALSDAISIDLIARRRAARADFDAFPFDFATFQEYRADDPDLEIARNDLSLVALGATWTISDAITLRARGAWVGQARVQADGGLATEFYEGDRRSLELTVDSRLGALGAFENIAFVLGAVAIRDEVEIAESFGFPPPSSFVTAAQDEVGAFVSAQARWRAVTITGAVRVDEHDGFGAAATWRLGASYDLGAVRIYAAVGTSYRAPTLYERFVSFGDPNLRAEEGVGWEIGADARIAAFGRDDGLTMAARLRTNDIDNLIEFGPFFIYANVARAELQSVEGEASLRPLEHLTLRASYTHTRARDADTGAALLRRPRHVWRAAAEWRHGPFDVELSWRSVGARADRLYGDDGFSDGVGLTPSYYIVRASSSFEMMTGARLFIAADNLFGEVYEPANGFAGAPRSVLVGVRLAP